MQWSEQAMIDAMKAVEDGMPVATVARQYNVPRTTLRDRMWVKRSYSKKRQCSGQAIIDAMKAVEDGMSVTRAARKHNVLATTLQDRVSSKRSFLRKLQWSQQAMIDAMKAVEDGMPVAIAARQHNVPGTTLRDRMFKDVGNGERPGQKPYLTEDEETKLAEHVIECASVGHSKTRAEVMAIAENTARDKKKLRKDKITSGWYQKFMKRQNNLILRERNPSGISADFRRAGIHSINQSGESRPTVEHEAEGNSKGGTSCSTYIYLM